MSSQDLAAALVAALSCSDDLDNGGDRGSGGIRTSVTGSHDGARACVDVPPTRWLAAQRLARDQLECDFFDWLGAVDERDKDPSGYAVVVHLWSMRRRSGLLIRTVADGVEARLDSVVEAYPGASWYEREASEMFGIEFVGHPDPRPLLLPAQFVGYPLRKDFVLVARAIKPWPGAVEPGEPARSSTPAEPVPAAGRRPARPPLRPPGVPDPAEWGPRS